MSRSLLRRISFMLWSLLFVCSIVATFGYGLAEAAASAPPPTTAHVTGIVTGPGGERLGNVGITATSTTTGQTYNGYDPSGSEATGSEVLACAPNTNAVLTNQMSQPCSLNPGLYELDVPAGIYNLTFAMQQASSGFGWNTENLQNVTISNDTTINAQLMPLEATNTLSGTFTDANGDPIPNAWVGIGEANEANYEIITQTDAAGSYSMAVIGGAPAYRLLAQASNTGLPGLPEEFSVSGTDSFNITGDTVENLQTPPTTTVTVLATDTSGNPYPNQPVWLYNYSDFYQNATPDETAVANTDANGYATLPVWSTTAYTPVPCVSFLPDGLIGCQGSGSGTPQDPLIISAAATQQKVGVITINNMMPVFEPVLTGQTDAINADEAGANEDIMSTSWNWGDGTVSGGTFFQPYHAQTVTLAGTHVYVQPGTYTAKVAVMDLKDDRGGVINQTQVTVATSVNAVSYSGTGTLSPVNPTISGVAPGGPVQFKFSAGYNKGQFAASAEVSFNKGQNVFASTTGSCTNFDVEGSTAWLYCITGGYTLVLIGTNNPLSTDSLRIQIYNNQIPSDGESYHQVMYDSEPGAPLSAPPTLAIVSGHVNVHN